MARQLREAGRASGDPNVPSLEAIGRNIRRWEGGVGGVSERYRLYYCKALGIGPAEFGPATVQRQVRAGVLSAAGRQWVAAVLGDVRDGLRDDAKQCGLRAGQGSLHSGVLLETRIRAALTTLPRAKLAAVSDR